MSANLCATLTSTSQLRNMKNVEYFACVISYFMIGFYFKFQSIVKYNKKITTTIMSIQLFFAFYLVTCLCKSDQCLQMFG